MKPWQNKKHVCLECVWMHQSDVYVVRLTLQAISVKILTEYERGYKRTGLVVGSPAPCQVCKLHHTHPAHLSFPVEPRVQVEVNSNHDCHVDVFSVSCSSAYVAQRSRDFSLSIVANQEGTTYHDT